MKASDAPLDQLMNHWCFQLCIQGSRDNFTWKQLDGTRAHLYAHLTSPFGKWGKRNTIPHNSNSLSQMISITMWLPKPIASTIGLEQALPVLIWTLCKWHSLRLCRLHVLHHTFLMWPCGLLSITLKIIGTSIKLIQEIPASERVQPASLPSQAPLPTISTTVLAYGVRKQ